jgi:hypothetical protein
VPTHDGSGAGDRERSIQDFIRGRASVFEGDFSRDKEFLAQVLDGILVYPDGSVVLKFAEDSLFAPVAAAELRGEHVGDASVEDARKLHREFMKETREWAEPDDQVVVIEGDGLIAYKTISAPGNRSGKTVGVPSGTLAEGYHCNCLNSLASRRPVSRVSSCISSHEPQPTSLPTSRRPSWLCHPPVEPLKRAGPG